MSGFLDKLKNGFAEAGNKAKVMVDVNRFKLQIGQEQREIKELYEEIGRKVFAHCQAGEVSYVPEEIGGECEKILRKLEAIRQLECKVVELNDEKVCPGCKQLLEKDVRFCPECGYQFDDGEDAEK